MANITLILVPYIYNNRVLLFHLFVIIGRIQMQARMAINRRSLATTKTVTDQLIRFT